MASIPYGLRGPLIILGCIALIILIDGDDTWTLWASPLFGISQTGGSASS